MYGTNTAQDDRESMGGGSNQISWETAGGYFTGARTTKSYRSPHNQEGTTYLLVM